MRTPMAGILALAAASVATSAGADGCIALKEPLDPREAHEPQQTAIIRYAGYQEDLFLQVRYAGATDRFAWIVPTPSRPALSKAPAAIFTSIYRYLHPLPRSEGSRGGGFGGMGGAGMGDGVAVLERSQVGIYDISVLAALDADDLVRWLQENGYNVADEARRVFAYYIERRWVFTAMRINLRTAGASEERVQQQLKSGGIEPIQLTFTSAAPVYPLYISSLNGGWTEVRLYVLTPLPVRTPVGFTKTRQREAPAGDLNKVFAGTLSFSQPMWTADLSRKMLSSSAADIVFQMEAPRRADPPGPRGGTVSLQVRDTISLRGSAR